MDEIIIKYRQWKKDNPEEGYQYDEIIGFFDQLSRGEMLRIMEWIEKNYKQSN